jgi:hypothetical protein
MRLKLWKMNPILGRKINFSGAVTTPELPFQLQRAQNRAAERELAPNPARFVLRSATSARPHFGRDSRAYATLAAGAGENERPAADAAYDEIGSRKPFAEKTMLYVTHV